MIQSCDVLFLSYINGLLEAKFLSGKRPHNYVHVYGKICPTSSFLSRLYSSKTYGVREKVLELVGLQDSNEWKYSEGIHFSFCHPSCTS